MHRRQVSSNQDLDHSCETPNPKHQTPENHQAPNFIRGEFGDWGLGILWVLGFGFWGFPVWLSFGEASAGTADCGGAGGAVDVPRAGPFGTTELVGGGGRVEEGGAESEPAQRRREGSNRAAQSCRH